MTSMQLIICFLFFFYQWNSLDGFLFRSSMIRSSLQSRMTDRIPKLNTFRTTPVLRNNRNAFSLFAGKKKEPPEPPKPGPDGKIEFDPFDPEIYENPDYRPGQVIMWQEGITRESKDEFGNTPYDDDEPDPEPHPLLDVKDPSTYVKNEELSAKVHFYLDRLHLPPAKRYELELRFNESKEARKSFLLEAPEIIRKNLVYFNQYIIDICHDDTAYAEHLKKIEIDSQYKEKFTILLDDLNKCRMMLDITYHEIYQKLVRPFSQVVVKLATNQTIRDDFLRTLNNDLKLREKYDTSLQQFVEFFTMKQYYKYNYFKLIMRTQGNDDYGKVINRRIEIDPGYSDRFVEHNNYLRKFMEKKGLIKYENGIWHNVENHPDFPEIYKILLKKDEDDLIPTMENDLVDPREILVSPKKTSSSSSSSNNKGGSDDDDDDDEEEDADSSKRYPRLFHPKPNPAQEEMKANQRANRKKTNMLLNMLESNSFFQPFPNRLSNGPGETLQYGDPETEQRLIEEHSLQQYTSAAQKNKGKEKEARESEKMHEDDDLMMDLLGDIAGPADSATSSSSSSSSSSDSETKSSSATSPSPENNELRNDFYQRLVENNKKELLDFMFRDMKEVERAKTYGLPEPVVSSSLPFFMDKINEMPELQARNDKIELVIPEGFILKEHVDPHYMPTSNKILDENEKEQQQIDLLKFYRQLNQKTHDISEADAPFRYDHDPTTQKEIVAILQVPVDQQVTYFQEPSDDGKLYISLEPYQNPLTGEKDYRKMMIVVPKYIAVDYVIDFFNLIDENDSWKSEKGTLPLGILRLPKHISVTEIPMKKLRSPITTIVIPKGMTVVRTTPGFEIYGQDEFPIIVGIPTGSQIIKNRMHTPPDHLYISKQDGFDNRPIYDISSLYGKNNESIFYREMLEMETQLFPNGFVACPPLTVVTDNIMDLMDSSFRTSYIHSLPPELRAEAAAAMAYQGPTEEEFQAYEKYVFQTETDGMTGKQINEGKPYLPNELSSKDISEGKDRLDQSFDELYEDDEDEEDDDDIIDVSTGGFGGEELNPPIDGIPPQRRRKRRNLKKFKRNNPLEDPSKDPRNRPFGLDSKYASFGGEYQWPRTPAELEALNLPSNAPSYALMYLFNKFDQDHDPELLLVEHRNYCRHYPHLIIHDAAHVEEQHDQFLDTEDMKVKVHIFTGHPGEDENVELEIEKFITNCPLIKKKAVASWVVWSMKPQEDGRYLFTPDRFKGRGGFPEHVERGHHENEYAKQEKKYDLDIFDDAEIPKPAGSLMTEIPGIANFGKYLEDEKNGLLKIDREEEERKIKEQGKEFYQIEDKKDGDDNEEEGENRKNPFRY